MEVSNRLRNQLRNSKNMPDKKSTDKNVRKLTKIGKKSIGLTLPIELVREFKWKERQKVTVKRSGKKIVIEDWKK
jgi:hypothetical protein